MHKKMHSGIMLTLLFVGTIALAFNIQPVKASGTIYIMSDGTVHPHTAPIHRDGNIYTLTDNIFESIVVLRSYIVIDGNGYKVEGMDAYDIGIDLSHRNNVTVKNTEVTGFLWNGIKLVDSMNNKVLENNVSNNGVGMNVAYSDNNIIIRNTFHDNNWGGVDITGVNNTVIGNTVVDTGRGGISLVGYGGNTISSNVVSDNYYGGIDLFGSTGNFILRNNVSNNGGCCGGIFLADASNRNTVVHNIVANYSGHGIYLRDSHNNAITDNVVSGNLSAHQTGVICTYASEDNTITRNTVSNNGQHGISICSGSKGNAIYHNNFINNTKQVHLHGALHNIWDDGYPSGGNYWSDYEERYPLAEELDGSGLWDTHYVIGVNNQDNYPLMEPWTPLPRTVDELKTEIDELGSEGEIDNLGIVKSLLAKLNVAQKLVDKGKIDEAISILEDDFIPQVENLTEIHITPEAAETLIESAEYILSHL